MPALAVGQAQVHDTPNTLAGLNHDYRPVLVFAAADNNSLREQMKLLAGRVQDMRERQMVVAPMLLHDEGRATGLQGLPEACVARLGRAEEKAARRRFHVGEDEFAVILLGKDGSEKLRSRTPVTMERLTKLIDAMPMRQKEARDGHSG